MRAAQDGRRGRWSLTGMPRASAAFPGAETGTGGGIEIASGAELAARVLRDRYGVVFRRLCTREPWLPPWRDLVAVYRRREACGESRSGHFVALASEEQFALLEAVGLLREVRHRAKSLELVSLSAADPLNLAGIVTPGGDDALGIGACPLPGWRPHRVAIGAEGPHERGPRPGRRLWEARKALLGRGIGASRLVVATDGMTTP